MKNHFKLGYGTRFWDHFNEELYLRILKVRDRISY